MTETQSAANIYIARAGQQSGPYTRAQVYSMLTARMVLPTDLAWHEGLPTWVPLGQLLQVDSGTYAASPGLPPMTLDYSRESKIPAGFGLRLGAFIIDWLITNVAGFFVGMAMRGQPPHDIQVTAQLLGGVTGLILGWLYSALMECSATQATLGKMACGIKVTDLDGKRISFARATGRYFSKIISGCILLIGYLMCLWTEKKQCLHDMMAGTLVLVKERK